MILIVNSNAVNTSWCLRTLKNVHYFTFTEKIHYYDQESSHFVKSLRSSISKTLDLDLITEVNFYGAGFSDEKSWVIQQAVRDSFPNTKTLIHIDLLAAARTVLGEKCGFGKPTWSRNAD